MQYVLVVAILWMAGAGALLAASASLLPGRRRSGAGSALTRTAVFAVMGLLCLTVAGAGIHSAPSLSAPSVPAPQLSVPLAAE